MSLTEALLLIITICVLLLAAAVIITAILLIRYLSVIVKLQERVDSLSITVEKEMQSTAEEVRNLVASYGKLGDSITNVVDNIAVFTMTRSVSPRIFSGIAGAKMGMDIVLKAYSLFSKTQKKKKKKQESE